MKGNTSGAYADALAEFTSFGKQVEAMLDSKGLDALVFSGFRSWATTVAASGGFPIVSQSFPPGETGINTYRRRCR